jgi:hypothetical protein
MQNICKICKKLEYKIADKLNNQGKTIYRNLDGKRWNGKACPECRQKEILKCFKIKYIPKVRVKKIKPLPKVYKTSCVWCSIEITSNMQRKKVCSKFCRARYRCRKYLYNTLARGKRVRKQTPKWANRKQIAEFYKNCPKGFHVDHIVPLKGKNVCGLHVIENLQYLTATENKKKSNKF